jgi:predicted transcriptional regulator
MTDTKETTEITIVLPRDLAEQLAQVARAKGRSQEVVAGDALAEWLEDVEDIEAADQVLRDGYIRYSEDEVRRRLGLER